MAKRTQVLEDAVLYLDGNCLAGMVSEIELPELEWNKVEQEGLGLLGSPEYPTRLDAMMSTITLTEFYEELAIAAADPFNKVNLQVRGNIAVYEAQDKTDDRLLKVDLSGRFMKNSLGKMKAGEMGEYKIELTCTYCKQSFNGQEILEVDVTVPIYRVNGSDKLRARRKNLGL